MADADLQTAASELCGEFTSLDVRSILVSTAGLGLGLFSAEFFAELAGNMLGSTSRRTRSAVEIFTKFGTAGLHLALRRIIGGPMLGVVLALGAVGSATSAVLQIIEVAVSALQTGEVASTSSSSTT